MVQDGSRSSGAAGSPYGDELALLLAGSSSDRAAFERLYELTHRRVFGLCLAIVGEEDGAEDATIEVYSQIFRQASSFDPSKGGVWTWLLSIARTRALDAARARKRRALHIVSDEVWGEVRSPGPDPSSWCVDAEKARVVRDLVAKLPAGQRHAIETAYFGGLSYSETASALDLPIGTIKTRIRAGLAALRRSFQAEERESR